QEWMTQSEMTYPLYMTCRWDEALATLAEIPEEQLGRIGMLISPLAGVLPIHLHRGEIDAARRLFDLYAGLDTSSEVQARSGYMGGLSTLRRLEGRHAEALEAGKAAMAAGEVRGMGSQAVKHGFVEAAEAAFALGDREQFERLLTEVEALPPGRRPAYLDAHVSRLRARLADEDAENPFRSAPGLFREPGAPVWRAVPLPEHGAG